MVSEAVVIDPLIVAPVVGFPLIFALLMAVMLKRPPKKKKTDISEKIEEVLHDAQK